MPQLSSPDGANARAQRDKALRILAKSIFRELKSNGYDAREVVALSTELLGLLTEDLKAEPAQGAEPGDR